MRCLSWPVRDRYQVVQFDGVATGAPSQEVAFGPPGSDNSREAWVVLNLTVSYNAPVIASGKVVPYYQFNRTFEERSVKLRNTLAWLLTDADNVFPVIGGMVGQQRPLYLPTPDELIIGLLGFPAGRPFQIRALVLKADLDTDVSPFL